jgi:predicted nucleotidyltransferase
MIKETEYQGKDVELNKPTKGDVKKYKVFVKDPSTGNVKKVNFGDPNMSIKRDDPERRKSFRARHKCDTAKDKTTPRYWSCKFWSKTNVSDLLKEVIEPNEVDVTSIQMNDELCPMIWDGDELKADVRKTLLLNTKRFIEYCDIQELKFEDIILIGSMANYNYNDNSDIDVHIIMDFSQISDNIEFVGEFFKMKKLMWSENMSIQVKGHDVEMYVQHSEDEYHSTGVYSIIKNKWISKPTKKIVNINTGAVQLKAADIMNIIDDLSTNKNKKDFLDKLENVKTKLKKMRQSGLESGGEFSVENLVFKILRNSGYINKLVDMKHEYMTQELSLDEIFNSNI